MAVFAPLPGVLAGDLGEDLASALVDVYTGIESRLTAEIARRLRKGLAEYPDLLEQLRVIRELRVEAERILNTVDTEGLAREAVRIAAEQGTAAAAARLGLAKFLGRPEGLVGLVAAHADALSLIALDLQNSFDQMHLRILRNVQDDYQRTIARMAPDLVSGTTTYTVVQQRIVNDFLARGITGFTDRAGRNWKIGSYTEMATRTATARAWNDASVYRMQESGINLVTPIVGRGACVRCTAWAKKILSTDGRTGTIEIPNQLTGQPTRIRIDATLDQAKAEGLHHPNCGCVDVAYMPGLPVAADATTYEPELEASRVRLRSLERRKRALLRQKEGAADEVTAKRFGKRIRDVEAEIRAHVDETGIQRQPYRERLSWSGG